MDTTRAIHVYVAGPLTSDPMGGARNAILAGIALEALGFIAYVPHASLLWEMVQPRDYETWIRHCFAWLSRCDCLLRLPGESSGSDREVEEAKRLRLPVFWHVDALVACVARPVEPLHP